MTTFFKPYLQNGCNLVNTSTPSKYANLTIPSGISTSYTLTLPSNTGTNNYFMKTDGNGALSWTNNAVDNVFTIVNSSDNTKKIQISAANVSASNTRTLTMKNGDLDLGSPLFNSLQTGVRSLTGNTTLDNSYSNIFGNAAGGAFQITLPASGTYTGIRYKIAKLDTGTDAITVAPQGTDVIDISLTAFTLVSQGDVITLTDFGSGFWMSG